MKEETLPRPDTLRGPLMRGCRLWSPILRAEGEPEKAGVQAGTVLNIPAEQPQDLGEECVAEGAIGKT